MTTEAPKKRITAETFDAFLAREVFIHGDARLKKPKIESLVERFTGQKQEILSTFFGREIPVPTPPKELFDTMLRAREINWTQAEAHFLPPLRLEQDSEIPGWKVRPEQWFWDQIIEGKITSDSATLDGHWVIVDGSQKPYDEDGMPMYEKDPFASVLEKLRLEGKIEAHHGWGDETLDNSRFNISRGELREQVFPAIAELLGVKRNQARLPKAIEFNFLGNIAHPEWNDTSTTEWFDDHFMNGDLLVGGEHFFLFDEGVITVSEVPSDFRLQNLGFRPMIVFPTTA